MDGTEEIITATSHIPNYTRIYDLLKTGIMEVEKERISDLEIYPNPTNSSITIKYYIPVNSLVTIEVFDVLGRKIETIVNETQSMGPHAAIWDASHVASGIYYYILQADGYTATKQMTILK